MWRYLLPLLMAIALGVLLFAGLGKDPKIIPSPLIDKPAPVFDLPELNQPDLRITNSTFAGQPYLLNVWASWCAVCQIEHPVIEALAREGIVRVVGLNWKDQPQDAKRWLAQFGNPYTDVPADVSGQVGIDFGVYGAPETFLIDPQGVIRFKHVGELTPEVIDAEIRPRLAQWKQENRP
jgi:cytochrome c biogenesis protein CcmG/thiol:disulfide interchange protein DsbE